MIQSIQRAVQIMDFMKEPDKSYSIKDISLATALSSSTVHRILATLVDCGYVMHDEVTHNYKLGYALISLGMAAIHNTKLQELAKTMLKELEEIRKTKVAISTGDYIPNGVGIGAPIFDHNDKIVASIGIIGTSTRINKNNIDDMAKIVFEIGKRLSRMMGYTRQY